VFGKTVERGINQDLHFEGRAKITCCGSLQISCNPQDIVRVSGNETRDSGDNAVGAEGKCLLVECPDHCHDAVHSNPKSSLGNVAGEEMTDA
jgi:hypothetical protein